MFPKLETPIFNFEKYATINSTQQQTSKNKIHSVSDKTSTLYGIGSAEFCGHIQSE